MKKQKNLLFTVLIIAVVFSACCKVYCIQNPDLVVLIGNFRAVDADTVYLMRYNKGNQQMSDNTAIVNNVFPADTINHSSLSKTFSPAYDWKIVVPSVNKQHLISQIETESGKCPCSAGNYTRISKSFEQSNPNRWWN